MAERAGVSSAASRISSHASWLTSAPPSSRSGAVGNTTAATTTTVAVHERMILSRQPKTGAACHRGTWGELNEWQGNRGGRSANADANNRSGHPWTRVDQAATQTRH